MTDLRYEYIIESREHLATFEQSVLALEKSPHGEVSKALIENGLRAIHSFKGDSGTLGFASVNKLAHAIESLLENYRDGNQIPGTEIVEALLAARDLLVAQLEDLDHPRANENAQMIDRLQLLETQAEPTIPVDVLLEAWLARNPGKSLLDFFREVERVGVLRNPRLSLGHGSLTQDRWDTKCQARLTGTLDTRLASVQVQHLQQWLAGELVDLPSSLVGTQKRTVHISLSDWHSSSGSIVALFRELMARGEFHHPKLQYGEVPLQTGLPTEPIEWIATTLAAFELPKLPQTVPPIASAANTVSAAVALSSRNVANASQTVTVARPSSLSTPPFRETPTQQTPAPQPTSPTASSKATEQEPVPSDIAIPPARPAVQPDKERLRSLRINVDLLDRMMNLIGELTLVRNQTLVTFEGAEGESRTIIQRLNSVTSELQDTVLQTRMQPVGNLFGRFPRMVRDLARQLGKEVEIVTVGEEVELDKTVLERLTDPLTHLIRNSIDHGLELPAAREATGKPRLGKITLTATPADGQVYIEIRDDGRGIDPAAIKSKAVAMRLRTHSELERMSNRELFSLILLPGFSTAQKVTDVSGRGVGMDVVRTNVEELEGSLTIDSWPGQGTSMQLRVPLTLAIVPCLIVTVGEERFAVPQRALEEIVCLHKNGKWTLEQSIDGEVMRLRNSLIPVVRFSELLSRPRPFSPTDKEEILRDNTITERNADQIEYILVLRSSGRRFGLLVDRVLGREEIVIKPMHAALKPISVFSGATLMGDGRVALIADVDGILEHVRCPGAKAEEVSKATIRDPHEVHRVLLFEHGPNEQFALPLVQIQRVELLDTKRIERIGTSEFANISGKSTRILRLSDMLKVSTCEDLPTMFLILPKFIPEPMGILATRIIDTESLAIDLQSNGCERGVLGTARVRDRLSLFLDVQQLREFVFGPSKEPVGSSKSNPREMVGAQQSSVPKRILLVDDTTFFREIVKRYLSSDDVEILTAIDGQQGLEMLAAHHVDLVVSDIEMPVMDGWQFCQAARDKGYQMPFVALTSLAKIENEDKAKSCGFDDFEEKLDHDRLRRKIQFWLSQSEERLASR
ncbi:MAG: hybrid sensor histidine kinase/response regulator [Pirellulaceae bacterium]|nr:hybrid sensor histidine kinase/response regulator [Pirellulaceae bacterium]